MYLLKVKSKRISALLDSILIRIFSADPDLATQISVDPDPKP
jgi:hypothetical protein